MKLKLSIIWLVLLAACTNAQTSNTSKLTGTIYDAFGSVIPDAKIIVTGSDSRKIFATSNPDGKYALDLSSYGSPPERNPGVSYDIAVGHPGFQTSEIKGYFLVQTEMHLDIGLRVLVTVDTVTIQKDKKRDKRQ